jgi:hypothetical protein
LNLLISADPGARANFIAAWLNGSLEKNLFDVGAKVKSVFLKYHTDWNNTKAKNYRGKKIRIKPSFSMLDLHLYLFLIKNVYPQIPELNSDQFSFDVTDKMIESAKEWFYHDQQIDLSFYDKVISFADTYDKDCLIELYQWFNNTVPSNTYLKILANVNKKNKINLSKNHSCRIASLILAKEHYFGLLEIDRFWSLKNIYKTTNTNDLYKTIKKLIHKNNYGKSDLHAVGCNDMTRKTSYQNFVFDKNLITEFGG